MTKTKHVLTAIAAGLAISAGAHAQARQPWMNTDLPVQTRVDLAIGAMPDSELFDLVQTHMPGMAPMPDGKWDKQNGAGWTPEIAQAHNIRILETDGSIGVGDPGDQSVEAQSMAYPSMISDAASWDPELLQRLGAMVGKDARDKGYNVLLSGGTNLVRDPRGGRNFEYLGEDPLLVGSLSAAYVQGVQSQHIVATLKHFALNDYETGRTQYDVSISRRAAMESDLLAFDIAIHDGKPGAIMCSYNLAWGDHTCESKYLLTDVLRDQWRFPGWVMSDWGAAHSTVKAALSGLDQESGAEIDAAMGLGGTPMLMGATPDAASKARIAKAQKSGALSSDAFYATPLKKALADGAISHDQLRDMAAHVLYGLYASGAVDHPVESASGSNDQAKATAEHAAEEGIVLLKNDHAELPIGVPAQKIVLIGAHADKGVLSGGGSPAVLPIGGNAVPSKSFASFSTPIWDPSSPLDALKSALPVSSSVRYSSGESIQDAVDAAKKADKVIVFADQWSREGTDLANLQLPGNQNALIQAVAAANPNTTVVLETQGPVTMPWLPHVKAVVEAWYPGASGGEAIAKVLTGAVNPSGHLPQTFPMRTADLPRPALPIAPTAFVRHPAAFPLPYKEGANVGYKWFAAEGKPVLFPFGYGLSYTTFSYAHETASNDNGIEVGVDVTNTGKRAGAEVAQVYVDGFEARGEQVQPRLVGWQRLFLVPGETRHLTIRVRPIMLATYDESTARWTVNKGDYVLRTGPSSVTKPVSAVIHIAAPLSLAGADVGLGTRARP